MEAPSVLPSIAKKIMSLSYNTTENHFSFEYLDLHTTSPSYENFFSVGIASESFGYKETGEFYLIPGVCVEGITPSTLQIYCTDLMFSGTCYKALNRISTPMLDTGKYKYEGIIFKVGHKHRTCFENL